MSRLFAFAAAALIIGIVAPAPAAAQQSFNIFLGGFVPHGIDARDDDVLFRESVNGGCLPPQQPCALATLNRNTGIDMSEFNSFTFGGEWLFGLGNNLEGGLGVGFYQRTVPTTYADLVNKNGTEIAQELKLRTVPFTATVRFLPTGRRSSFVPYIGAGVGIMAWRYSETGQFVDSTDRSTIFAANFVGSGGAVGPVILGGVRVPLGGAAIGGEVRYQSAKGDLSTDDFIAPKIDLGGFNYLFTVAFRF
jgi:hypothetical protein